MPDDPYLTQEEFARLSSDAHHAIWGAGEAIDSIPVNPRQPGGTRRYHREQVRALLEHLAVTA